LATVEHVNPYIAASCGPNSHNALAELTMLPPVSYQLGDAKSKPAWLEKMGPVETVEKPELNRYGLGAGQTSEATLIHRE